MATMNHLTTRSLVPMPTASRRFMLSSWFGLLLIGGAPVMAQDHTLAWGSIAMDTRWHQRTDAVEVQAAPTNTVVRWADGTLGVVGATTYQLQRVPALPPGR